MNQKTFIPLLTAAMLIITNMVHGQIPPHESLIEKIESGKIEMPWVLENIRELRAKGIDAPSNTSIKTFFEKTRQQKSLCKSHDSLENKYNILVVCVGFTDKPFNQNLVSFDEMIYSGKTKSLKDYLREITYGNLSITTLNLPSQLGKIIAPETYAYYCDNQSGMGTYPRNSKKLVEDVLDIIDPQVDFSKYDNDGDGFVDALFIVHAGIDAGTTGSGNDMWSHAWAISPRQKDGVKISRYSIVPEYNSSPGDAAIGVIAHEMGHAVFGFYDAYDYDFDSACLGNWSLMGGGGYNGVWGDSPAHPDAWNRIKMGIVEVMDITSDVKGFEIKNVEENPVVYRIYKKGIPSHEYFLLENRQRKGYDSKIPGSGLLIYHIDESVYSNDYQWYPGYTDFGHYRIALEQADGLWELEKKYKFRGGDTGDPFPGNKNKRIFNSTSIPDSKDYNFQNTYISIFNISNSADVMTVDISLSDSGTVTGTYEKFSQQQVLDFALEQNYPNPFNPTTVISYRIPAYSHVSLKVYDILGREIVTLVDEFQNVGNYEVKFNGSNLGIGVYLCRIKAGRFTQTHKMLLLK